MKPATRALLVVLCVAAGSTAAAGGQATTTLDVKATIVAQCQFSNLTSLNFGTFGVLTTERDATATFKLQCTANTPYTIGITSGNGSTSTTDRMMYGASPLVLQYGLYRDSTRTLNWGNEIGSFYTGTYTDTITVTVTY